MIGQCIQRTLDLVLVSKHRGNAEAGKIRAAEAVRRCARLALFELRVGEVVAGAGEVRFQLERLPVARTRLVEAAYRERSVLPARDIRVTSFGNRVQEAGAGVVSLGGIYADPIGAMRRALARRPEATA